MSGPLNRWPAIRLFALMGKAALALVCKRELKVKAIGNLPLPFPLLSFSTGHSFLETKFVPEV